MLTSCVILKEHNNHTQFSNVIDIYNKEYKILSELWNATNRSNYIFKV